MKTLKFIFSLIVALLTATMFVACSNDGDDEETSEDLLTGCKWTYDHGRVCESVTVSYDEKKRICSVYETIDEGKEYAKSNVSYEKDKIEIATTLRYAEGEEEKYEYGKREMYLSGGRVFKEIRNYIDNSGECDTRTAVFEYDSNGRLVKRIHFYDDGGSEIFNYVWEGDNIKQAEELVIDEYSGIACDRFLCWIFYDIPSYFLSGGCFGQIPQYLPKRGHSDYRGDVLFDYEVKDGRVVKCTVKDNSDTETIEFYWQ